MHTEQKPIIPIEQTERNKSILKKYIPEPAVDIIANWILHYDFKLKIKRGRNTKFGDYRSPLPGTNHQITINNNLNPFAFLITLVHEIAHLTNFNKHKSKVKPHGDEWKHEFRLLMQPFFAMPVFPENVKAALLNYLSNPAASSCSDLNLYRVLKQYDKNQHLLFLEELPLNAVFKINPERHFIKGDRVRKRFLCKEVKSGKKYLFSPLSEVEHVTD